MKIRQSIRSALYLLLAACVACFPQFSSAQSLAAGGKLRMLSFGNGVLYPLPPQAPTDGVAHAYARYIAQALNAELVPVVLQTPDAYSQALAAGDYDITIGPRIDGYAQHVYFGPDVAFVEFSYVSAPGKSFADVASVDRPGVRVGAGRNSAPDVYLTSNLKNAQLVRTAGGPAPAMEAIRSGAVDVYASNAEVVAQIAAAMPGSSILGIFFSLPVVVSVPKTRPADLQTLAEIVRKANAAGVARDAIQRLSLKGVRAAD